ncbi:MAG: hypothetical protein JWO53_539 [Chlamydiia bacterium]|nr:hypothetical protein [Chlamydiia bacterium]
MDLVKIIHSIVDLKNYLEAILKRDADLVTKNALHPTLKKKIIHKANMSSTIGMEQFDYCCKRRAALKVQTPKPLHSGSCKLLILRYGFSSFGEA